MLLVFFQNSIASCIKLLSIYIYLNYNSLFKNNNSNIIILQLITDGIYFKEFKMYRSLIQFICTRIFKYFLSGLSMFYGSKPLLLIKNRAVWAAQ